MPLTVLGKGVLALTRQGDYAYATIRPVSRSLPLSYTVVSSQYAKSLALSTTILGKNVAPLLLAYQTTPIPDFALNGDGTIIRPDHITYTPAQPMGRTLLGGGLLQGYKGMIWNYGALRWSEFAHLLSFYSPTMPVVSVTYPDETGNWSQRQAVLLPPSYGTQVGTLVYDVSLTFTRL